MPVDVEVEEDRKLTVIKCTDPWTLRQYLDAYPDNVTPLVLFDLLNARDAHWIDIDVLRQMNAQSAQYDEQRRGGRTAIVVPDQRLEMLAKMFADLAGRVFERPFERRVFHDRDEALAWLLTAA